MAYRVLVVLLVILVFVASAYAQETSPTAARPPLLGEQFPLVAHINAGFQFQTQDFRQETAFSLYDETGSWDAAHASKGGAAIDIGGALGLQRLSSRLQKVFVGVTFTVQSKHRRDVFVSARVPHPVFTDATRSADVIAPDFVQSERAVHFQMLYQIPHIPMTRELDVMLFAGPSLFSVRDDLIEAVHITEVGGDFSTVNVATARSRHRESGAGFNLGMDARYPLLRNIAFVRELGVGTLLRYSRGRVDFTLPGDSGRTQKVDAGGPEFAVGLRLAF